MAPRVRKGKTSKPRLGTAVRSFGALTRRTILMGALLTVVLLAMFAANSFATGAVTVPAARTPAVRTLTVATPAAVTTLAAIANSTVTSPAGKTPAFTFSPVNALSVVTPRPGSTLSLSEPGAQGALALPATALSATTGASLANGRSAAVRHTLAPRSGASDQSQLRSGVVRLSQCLSTLGPRSQWTLVLRAGIGMAQPYSRRAVARVLQVSVVREARIEHAALLKLQTAARAGSCGSIPALIHVPARDRMVLVDPALTNPF